MKAISSLAQHTATVDNMPLAPKPHNIAQVIVPNSMDSLAVVLPMVASLTHLNSERWITWITHRQPSKEALLAYGADISRLRIVHCKAGADTRWIVWQALAQQNSHTVIAEQNYWHPDDIDELEAISSKSQVRGVMISLPKNH